MRVLEAVPDQLWLSVAQACPWATCFHTPAWAASIRAEPDDYEARAIGFCLEDGTTALVPALVRRKRRLLKSSLELKSMEPGVYGGIIAARKPGPDETARIADHLRRLGSGRLTQSPFEPIAMPAPFIGKNLFTHVVDLAPDFEQIRRKFNRGQKSNLNQARKKGVRVRRAETAADIDAYWDMYQKTLARWAEQTITQYPRELFDRIFTLCGEHAQYWLAEVDGCATAGILVLVWNRTMVYWHGCALDDYYAYYPGTMLQASAIEWGCEHGFHFYDLGASMGLEGLIRFKRSFGAREAAFITYRWK